MSNLKLYHLAIPDNIQGNKYSNDVSVNWETSCVTVDGRNICNIGNLGFGFLDNIQKLTLKLSVKNFLISIEEDKDKDVTFANKR